MQKLINLIACGQSGTRIGKIFKKSDYRVSFMNMDNIDSINVNEPEFTIQTGKGNSIVIDGSGTGRSLKKGKQIIENNKEKINAFLKSNTFDDKINVLVAGLGGGTGSSLIVYASQYIKDVLNRRIALISALPTQTKVVSGTLRCRENAYLILRDIKGFKYDFFFLVDNEKMCKKYNIDPLVDGYDRINQDIFNTFNSVKNICVKANTDKYIGSIDNNELLSVIVSGGLLNIISEKVSFEEIQDLEAGLFLRKHELIDGYDYRMAKAFIISFGVPIGKLPDNVKMFIKGIESKFNSLSEAGFTGIFETPDLVNKLQINIIANGLNLPKIVRSRIRNLTRDKDRAGLKEQLKEDRNREIFNELSIEDNNEDLDSKFDF